MLATKHQLGPRKEAQDRYPVSNDYENYGIPVPSHSSASYVNPHANAERPETRKKHFRSTGVNWNSGKKKVYPRERDPSIQICETAGDENKEIPHTNRQEIRVVVTRGKNQGMLQNEYLDNMNLIEYDFNSGKDVYAYTTSSGFYPNRGRCGGSERPNKHMSVSPRRDIVLKEQQAFNNLKAFLEANNKEERTIKKSFRAQYLLPLSNVNKKDKKGRGCIMKEGINEETEEDTN